MGMKSVVMLLGLQQERVTSELVGGTRRCDRLLASLWTQEGAVPGRRSES